MKKLIVAVTLVIVLAACNSGSAEKPLTNGEQIETYASGKMKAEGVMENGKKVGEWKSYTEEGVLTSVSEYHNGKQQGLCTEYDADGKVSAKGNLKDGKREGIWQVINPDGTSAIEFYKNGVKTQ